MTETRDWLPVGAAAHRNVRSRIAKAVGAWSDHWFTRRTFTTLRYQERQRGFDSRMTLRQWAVYRGAAAIRCPTASASALLEAALGMRLAGLDLSMPDIQLLDLFTRKVMTDLARRLEEELGVDGQECETPDRIASPFGLDDGLEISLAEGQGPEILTIALPMQALLPACREALPRPSRRGPLAGLKGALGPTTVPVCASLGAVELDLQDLANLSVGDVVVLGGGLHQAADVSLSEGNFVFAHARLTDVDGQMALAFHDE